jgi:hypothetical protein
MTRMRGEQQEEHAPRVDTEPELAPIREAATALITKTALAHTLARTLILANTLILTGPKLSSTPGGSNQPPICRKALARQHAPAPSQN